MPAPPPQHPETRLKGGTCVMQRVEALLVSLGNSFSLTMTGFLGRLVVISIAGFTWLGTLVSGGALGTSISPVPWAVWWWLRADRMSCSSYSGGKQPVLPPLLSHRLLLTSSGKAGTGPSSSTRAPHNSRSGHEHCWTWLGSPWEPPPSVPATPRCLPSPRPCHLPSLPCTPRRS